MSAKTKGSSVLEGVRLSMEKLRTFREKSKFMVPRCFGGYNESDLVCWEWCSLAHRSDLEERADKLADSINEMAGRGFFHNGSQFYPPCEEEKRKLLDKQKEVEHEIKLCNEQRKERDSYYLAEGSDGLHRIQVGKVRWEKDFPDFAQVILLYLETQDIRLFAHPYGPMYNDAVGRVLEIHPGGAGPEDSEAVLGYVKSITPELPDAWRYPLKVLGQSVNKEGDLVLVAEICHRKNSTKETIDQHGTDGKEVTIVLYGDSAKISVRVDDMGRL